MTEPIRKLYADPARTKVRAYRVVVDAPRDPATGDRKQLTRTFTTHREARDQDPRVTFEAIGRALGGTGKPQTKQTAAARYDRVKARQTTRRGRR